MYNHHYNFILQHFIIPKETSSHGSPQALKGQQQKINEKLKKELATVMSQLSDPKRTVDTVFNFNCLNFDLALVFDFKLC